MENDLRYAHNPLELLKQPEMSLDFASYTRLFACWPIRLQASLGKPNAVLAVASPWPIEAYEMTELFMVALETGVDPLDGDHRKYFEHYHKLWSQAANHYGEYKQYHDEISLGIAELVITSLANEIDLQAQTSPAEQVPF